MAAVAVAAASLPYCCTSGCWSTCSASIARSTRTSTFNIAESMGCTSLCSGLTPVTVPLPAVLFVSRGTLSRSRSSSSGRRGSRTRNRISQQMRHCLLPSCCLDGSGCLSLSQSRSLCRGSLASGSGNLTCTTSRSACRYRCISSLAGAGAGDPSRLGGSASQAAAASASVEPGNGSAVIDEGSGCQGRGESSEQEQEQQRQKQKQSGKQHHDAIIVGGGLAGLATAIALRRHGLDAHVYEKREIIGGGEGTMIVLYANGLHALSQICPDIMPKLYKAGCCNFRTLIVGPDGAPLPVNAPQLPKSLQAPCSLIAICWSHMLNLLTQQLPPHCLHLDHAFGSHHENSDGSITANFCRSDGRIVQASAPLMVGADGIRSEVRRKVFGMENDDVVRDKGRTIWRTIVDFEKNSSLPGVRRNHSCVAISKGCSVALSDAGSNSLFIACVVPDSARAVAKTGEAGATTSGLPQVGDLESEVTLSSTNSISSNKGGSGGAHWRRSKDGLEAVAKLRELFRGWDIFQQALEVVDPQKMLERRLFDVRPINSWVKGNILIIGDAAHAVTPAIGQGANLAFEDAWELGEFLHAAGDIRVALQAFESVRMPRAHYIADENEKMASGKREEVLADRSDFMFGYKGVNHAEVITQTTVITS